LQITETHTYLSTMTQRESIPRITTDQPKHHMQY